MTSWPSGGCFAKKIHNSDLGCLVVEGSKSYTVTNTHPVGLLWTNDRLVARWVQGEQGVPNCVSSYTSTCQIIDHKFYIHAMGRPQPPLQRYRGSIPGEKRPDICVDHPALFRTQVTNDHNCNSTPHSPICVFCDMLWCTHWCRDNITLYSSKIIRNLVTSSFRTFHVKVWMCIQ